MSARHLAAVAMPIVAGRGDTTGPPASMAGEWCSPFGPDRHRVTLAQDGPTVTGGGHAFHGAYSIASHVTGTISGVAVTLAFVDGPTRRPHSPVSSASPTQAALTGLSAR